MTHKKTGRRIGRKGIAFSLFLVSCILFLAKPASASVCIASQACTPEGVPTIDRCFDIPGADGVLTDIALQQECETLVQAEGSAFSDPRINPEYVTCIEWSPIDGHGAAQCPKTGIQLDGIPARWGRLNKIAGTSGLSSQASAALLAGRGVFFLLGSLGMVSLVMCVYAGLLWMARGGNPSEREKAEKILLWSILGIVAALGSYGMVQFVFDVLKIG